MISGSKALLPVVLALRIYSISLRLTVNTCFLQVSTLLDGPLLFMISCFHKNYPVLSGFLHAVPLLGTVCMAGIELVLDMQSPALAVVVLLMSVLLLITTIVHHGRQCEGTLLPIRMQDMPPTISDSSDTTVDSNYVDSEVRTGQAL